MDVGPAGRNTAGPGFFTTTAQARPTSRTILCAAARQRVRAALHGPRQDRESRPAQGTGHQPRSTSPRGQGCRPGPAAFSGPLRHGVCCSSGQRPHPPAHVTAAPAHVTEQQPAARAAPPQIARRRWPSPWPSATRVASPPTFRSWRLRCGSGTWRKPARCSFPARPACSPFRTDRDRALNCVPDPADGGRPGLIPAYVAPFLSHWIWGE
jgi:hypothetical protein